MPLPVLEEEQSQSLYDFSSEFLHTPNRKPVNDEPEISVHSCHRLLCSSDLDQNRLGLQHLESLIKDRTMPGLCPSEISVSHALVYGGDAGSIQEELRYAFAAIMSDIQLEHLSRIQKQEMTTGDAKESITKHQCDNRDDFDDDDSTNPYLDEDDLVTLEDCADGTWLGTYETRLLANGLLATDPYISTALLSWNGNVVRMSSILNGRGHHEWTGAPIGS